MKVISIDDESDVVFVRMSDGRYAAIPHMNPPLPDRGDIIIANEDGWQFAPENTWTQHNQIAVVRQILPDGTIIAEDGIYVFPIKNSSKKILTVGNTFEHNDIDGIVRKISDFPIKASRFENDEVDVEKEYRFDTTNAALSFNDFGGYENVKSRARELIETQLLGREFLRKIGAKPVKGVLFTGLPGTGKTHLARIIACESGADFYLVSGPSIISKWLGDTEGVLRSIFDAATKSKSGKAIIFFDEIDSIAERRTGSTHEASKRLVAQLLTLMDGFDDKGKDVIVIAATNRVEYLDPALTRPGRFDWEIEFGIPTQADRAEILKAGGRTLSKVEPLPIDELAAATEGWSAAELTSLWTEAALVAAGDKRTQIAAEDLALALERVAKRPKRHRQDEVES